MVNGGSDSDWGIHTWSIPYSMGSQGATNGVFQPYDRYDSWATCKWLGTIKWLETWFVANISWTTTWLECPGVFPIFSEHRNWLESWIRAIHQNPHPGGVSFWEVASDDFRKWSRNGTGNGICSMFHGFHCYGFLAKEGTPNFSMVSGMIMNSCRSFPHSLRSTSKLLFVLQKRAQPIFLHCIQK